MDVPAGARLDTDRALFGSILANLFSNAVEYTPTGGTILIRHTTQGDRWSFSVTNTAGHLRPEDLPHLFQRFWRKDTARSTPEHSGLGLSLARAFADTLEMTLRAELVNERELAMTLEARNNACDLVLCDVQSSRSDRSWSSRPDLPSSLTADSGSERHYT